MTTRPSKIRADEILARDVLISEMQAQIEQLKNTSIESQEKFEMEMIRQNSYTAELELRLQESTLQINSFWESVPTDMKSVVKSLLDEAEPQHNFEETTNDGGSPVSNESPSSPPRPQSAPPHLSEIYPRDMINNRSFFGSKFRRSSAKFRIPIRPLLPNQKRALSPTSPSTNESNLTQSEWLSAFNLLLESAGLPAFKGEGIELLKSREKIRSEVERLMMTPDRSSKTFMSIVDSSDPLIRSHWLDEVAIHFRVVGMLLKVMHSTQALSWSLLDAKSSYNVFVSEVSKVLAPGTVTSLWLVNQERARIWKWDPNLPNPRQHHFICSVQSQQHTALRPSISGPSEFLHGEQASVFFDAETNFFQSTDENAADGDDHHPKHTIDPEMSICEPVYFDESIVAVIQCTNAQLKFATYDQTFLRLLAKYSGFLFRRIALYENNVRMVESTMNIIALTRLYPSDESDIFALACVQLEHARALLSASQCVLYLVTREDSPDLSGLRMWSHRVDGLCTRIEFRLGNSETSIVGWVAEHEEVVILDHPDEDGRFNYEIDTARSSKNLHGRLRTQNLLAMPIKMADTSLFGVCVMLNKRGSNFTQSDSRILGLVCEQLVLGLTLDGSEPAAVPQENLLEGLNRARTLLSCSRVALFRANKDSRKLVLRHDPGTPGLEGQREMGEVTVPICDDLIGYVARTGLSIRVADARAEPRFNPDLSIALRIEIVCLMCVAVHTIDNPTIVAGVLLCVNKLNAAEFSEEDEAVAKMLAKQIMRLDSSLHEEGVSVPTQRHASELQEEPTHT